MEKIASLNLGLPSGGTRLTTILASMFHLQLSEWKTNIAKNMQLFMFVSEFKIALSMCSLSKSIKELIVRKAEVILPTFLRGKSIFLLNCPLDA